jgi:isoquinoline 1-oxidoreductase beta subunit
MNITLQVNGATRTIEASASFGELAAAAAQLDPSERPKLKPRAEYSIVGTPRARLDIPSKVNGAATYGIHVVLPEMLYAAVAAAPVSGARLESVDATARVDARRAEGGAVGQCGRSCSE